MDMKKAAGTPLSSPCRSVHQRPGVRARATVPARIAGLRRLDGVIAGWCASRGRAAASLSARPVCHACPAETAGPQHRPADRIEAALVFPDDIHARGETPVVTRLHDQDRPRRCRAWQRAQGGWCWCECVEVLIAGGRLSRGDRTLKLATIAPEPGQSRTCGCLTAVADRCHPSSPRWGSVDLPSVRGNFRMSRGSDAKTGSRPGSEPRGTPVSSALSARGNRRRRCASSL